VVHIDTPDVADGGAAESSGLPRAAVADKDLLLRKSMLKVGGGLRMPPLAG